MIAMLILQTGMLGVFISLDLFLFYMFWELMLIPMYLIIGVWGGPRRIYATIKFFVYTMAGSVLMLIAIIFLYFMHYNETGEYTFDLLKIYNLDIPLGAQFWLFLAFFFRVCNKGTNVSVSYMVAGCSCGGSNGRQCYTGRVSC